MGSTSLVTDDAGNERERLYYAPFGGRVDIDGNPPTGPPSNVRDGFTAEALFWSPQVVLSQTETLR